MQKAAAKVETVTLKDWRQQWPKPTACRRVRSTPCSRRWWRASASISREWCSRIHPLCSARVSASLQVRKRAATHGSQPGDRAEAIKIKAMQEDASPGLEGPSRKR